MDYGLFFQFDTGVTTKFEVAIFADADWAGDTRDAKSVSGAVVMINGIPIEWHSKKQSSVALSTMEAEYVAAAVAVKDCIWSAIKVMENEMATQRSKHINIRFHFIRDTIAKGDVVVKYCPTQEQLADIFTKPLQRVLFERLRLRLRVVSVA
ncbi:hypothetical protein PHPALM_10785 [Phytophthora palmivora]|uniref:Polyprotein n=1 Tax=Phytophthora palmivora TaxID=4796 RepID=A0A2P4Y3V1_9STRA|nr:hypothetical protein PHPALM_10785 [Phytophthora palmivora]